MTFPEWRGNKIPRIGSNVFVADEYPCIVGDDVVVGHSVNLHGCTIEDAVLLGIGATVLNNVKIGYGCIIGAGSLITQGTQIHPYSLVLGSPGKVIREVSREEVTSTLNMAGKYVWVKNNYLKKYEK